MSLKNLPALALFALLSAPAYAQQSTDSAESSSASDAAAPVSRGGVVQIQEEQIIGEIPRPSVQIVITRSDLATDSSLELKENFIPLIVESVEEKPF